MRLATANGITLVLVAWAGAPLAVSWHARHPQGEALSADPELERQLVEDARAALAAVDLVAAREIAGEAIGLLLAHPESERDAAWLELLDAAGAVAWAAQDAHAARAAFEVVLAVRRAALPDEHPEVQWARGNLASTLHKLGDLAAARALQEQVLEVLSRTLPDEHQDLQWARESLANTLYKLGDLAGARALQEQVLEVRARALPDEHPELQKARQNFANTLAALGDLAAARALQEQVLEVRTRTLPDDSLELQWARANLANTLATLGEIAAARALQEQVLEVFSRALPDAHPDLQVARLNLSAALSALGDFAAARALQEKALAALTQSLPDDHPNLQAARLNLAGTLHSLGDLAASRALLEQVLAVFSRTLPDDHPDLQLARANLASTLNLQGELAAARALQATVLEIRTRTLPDDHPELQRARANLAGTLTRLGEFATARELQQQVLATLSTALPEEHPDVQRARLNLAVTLAKLGELAAARALEEQAIEVLARTLPEDHADLQWARGNLPFTLAAERASWSGREVDEDAAGFVGAASAFTAALARAARAAVLDASVREAEERCASPLSNLGFALSFADGLGLFESDPRLEREVFVLSELTRGAALASAHLARRAGADQGYSELRAAVRTASDELARLAQHGASAAELDRARSARERAERELARLAREISGPDASGLDLDPAALSASLAERDALVGYRRYPRWTYEPGGEGGFTAIESLCAFVLRSGDRLVRVELGPIEPIERAVERWRAAIGLGAGRGVGVDRPRAADAGALRIEGAVVRRLVFDPLLPALEGAGRIVVVLDDVLHLVPLDALPLEAAGELPGVANGSLLGDRWRIETRCTLSELSRDGSSDPSSDVLDASCAALVAIGGAAFDLPPLHLAAEEPEPLDREGAMPSEVCSLLRGGAWEAGFAPLDETGVEAAGIADLHRAAFGADAPTFVLAGRRASRTSLAELAPRARFLHVATHGWFAPELVRSMADPEPLDAKLGFGLRASGAERARGMSPMLLCGLALAGANRSEDDLGRAPGLVTAEELSALDLAACELAVLSACDTNVGERRAGQGVASLQKALHMAGARTVITSLWKVPDEATRVLMQGFYRRAWIEQEPKGVALWQAKLELRNAQDEHGQPRFSTRDWAAWVLTGDPR